MKKIVSKILSWAITIVVPLIFILTAVRLLLTPAFPMIEYRFPWFPADDYGFSMDDRLKWAEPSINYLVSDEDIGYLEDLKFEDGSPIYDERELSHMMDVKILVTLAIKVWMVSVVIAVVAGLLLMLFKANVDLVKGFSRGGWFSIGLVGTLLLMVVINFNELFNQFHYLFFQGDTWLFYSTDTLIRLFPLRFWSDAFIFVGVFTLIGGLMLGLGLRHKCKLS